MSIDFDPANLTAIQAAHLMRDGVITSEDLVQACLNRIEALEPEVQAWAHLDPDLALQQARARDDQRLHGGPLGPLHGVPVGLKDIIDTRAWPTENGTVVDAGRQPTEDASIVHLLAQAGAVLMGKTVSTELAVYGPGKTRNPHNTDHTPGGSSSGSAAAVAAGMVPLAIGTQTNGSVIRPASYCGVFGFKPTHGRISRHGVLSLSRFLDHIGVFARSVDDVALISDALMQFDAQDPDMVPTAAPKIFETATAEPPADLKYAFVKTAAWADAADDAKEAILELVDALGDTCEEAPLPESFGHVQTYMKRVMNVDLAYNLADHMKWGEEQLTDVLKGMIEDGRQTSALDYLHGRDARSYYAGLLDETFEECDALLTLSTVTTAPEGMATGSPSANSLWSLTGLPAISLPLLVGENDMPLGVQLVGPRGDDARLLRAANWLINTLNGLEDETEDDTMGENDAA